jgi:LCP family protein required for cell wall assembly
VSYPLAPRPADHGRAIRYRLLIGGVVLALAFLATWLALVIVVRVEDLLAPGQLNLGGLSVLPGVDDDDEVSTPQGRLNILVLGMDRRPNEGDTPTRTDTMFVLTIDPATKRGGILSIPRDLWVEIPYPDQPGYFEGKINGVFVNGEALGYEGGGPALVRRVIQRELNIPIDHYILIDFDAFIQVIDDLGGIDVDVPEVLDDPTFSETEQPGDYTPLHFEPGMTHMDGQTALDYSRSRTGTSDLDRIRRQQLVIFAALDKAVSLNLLTKAPELWQTYKDAIQTDINDVQIPGYAALARDVPPERIYGLTLGNATVSSFVEGQSVLLADDVLVQQMVDALFSDDLLSEEGAVVEVQNGSGVNDLAAEVVHFLTGIGFNETSLSAQDVTDSLAHPETEIVDFTNKPNTTQRLASALGVPAERVRAAGPQDANLRVSQADVVVILGSDAQAERFQPNDSSSGT